ncbi:DEAD/DEAH box helicase [Chitinophaga defluvii]|uniref:DEAD/DEAH box helicase n=1 Tax=Chitinophaga defluvii TaxID=3163343 RepID=A0ABV2SZT7_9BACT
MYNEAFYLKQYETQDEPARLVMDILSIYVSPLDRSTLYNTVIAFRDLTPKMISEIMQHLAGARLVSVNVVGNYVLAPELVFILFPLNVKREEYLPVLDQSRSRRGSIYSNSNRLLEIQHLLTTFFTGNRDLLLQPIQKMELELEEYEPFLFYLLYYPVYAPLLRLFSEQSMLKLYQGAVRYNLLKMPPIAILEQFQAIASGYINGQELQVAELPVLKEAFQQIPVQAGTDMPDSFYARAVVFLYDGATDQALTAFEQGIKVQRRTDKKNSIPVSPVFAFYYALTLTLLPEEKGNVLIAKIVAAYERKLFPQITPAISLLHLHNGRKEKAENLLQVILDANQKHAEHNLLGYLSLIGLQLLHPKSKLLLIYNTTAKVLLNLAITHEYRLLTYEYLYLFAADDYLGYEQVFAAIASSMGKSPVFSRMQKTPDWERLLNTLLITSEGKTKKEKELAVCRVIYLVDLDRWSIQPASQVALGDSGWATGKGVALKKLKEGKVEGMTEQDVRIAATVQRDNSFNYSTETYSFEENVWQELAGHPYLFLMSDPAVPVEVVKAAPELFVNKTDKGYIFSTNIHENTNGLLLVKETDTRAKVIKLTARQRTLLQTIRQIPVVPVTGKDKLLEVLRNIGAHITVHSDLGGSSGSIKMLEADARICIKLLPLGDTLKAELFVRPFSSVPPYCKPGIGARNIIGTVNGVRYQATRDLEKETANAHQLIAYIQEQVVQEVREDHLIFEDPLDCLHLLEVIKRYPELVVAEWPEGERFKIRQQAGFEHLHISLKANDYWFTCEGTLQVDEVTVLSIKELLDVISTSSSRFVPLGNGDYLALSGELRRRLQELASIAVTTHNGIKIHQFAAPLAEELLAQAGSMTTDKTWQSFRQKWEAAQELSPKVPATLQTTLRPYQEEGFRWMVHLAGWGAGACLADDMGLGKTIQAIAILLHRASEGPALVVCPASLVPNWTSELTRFAPSLQVVLLNGAHRAKTLQAAAAFDVVITTYGMLQSEESNFAAVKWATIVLDEAHTIKNYQTKTSKAVMALKGGFKLILTGTPIQNHLGEIWNLFHFINPGLLGTIQHFNKQFTDPLRRYPDSTVKLHLKKLIAPFILRRTKTVVADELPAKTEIVKLVALSPDEAAFYEAMRRKALEVMQAPDADQMYHHKHVKALAEIGKLRMAACHPQLIDAGTDIASSKETVLLEIVAELIANHHCALVFSQFVRHLSLIKAALDRQGISYLYLDGATPIAQRDALVRQFQAGEAPLFLISLKAGGLGLNLTAADYVIHLDPWWNPAVEDQAADRAYRLGQTRPVTVYRLIAKHTIEEKIIALHHTKRDLAGHLLEGTDQAARLSARELMELIQDE